MVSVHMNVLVNKLQTKPDSELWSAVGYAQDINPILICLLRIFLGPAPRDASHACYFTKSLRSMIKETLNRKLNTQVFHTSETGIRPQVQYQIIFPISSTLQLYHSALAVPRRGKCGMGKTPSMHKYRFKVGSAVRLRYPVF